MERINSSPERSTLTPNKYIDIVERLANNLVSNSEKDAYEKLNVRQRIELGLNATAPEILHGRLPESQVKNSELPDNYDYLVAVSMNGLTKFDELEEYFKEHDASPTSHQANFLGDHIHVPGNLSKDIHGVRFLCSPEEMVRTLLKNIDRGSQFNLVISIPFKVIDKNQKDALGTAADLGYNGDSFTEVAIRNKMMPPDLTIKIDGRDIVNEKYVAGLIDNDGIYVANENIFR